MYGIILTSRFICLVKSVFRLLSFFLDSASLEYVVVDIYCICYTAKKNHNIM